MLNSLRIGNAGEKKVIDTFAHIGIILEKEESRVYDLVCKSPPFKVEVKNDAYAARSNNIAIEVHNTRQDKPSGIKSTEADFWAHIAFDKIHFCSVKKLISWVDSTTPDRIIERGGDKNARLYIYSYDTILPVFLKEEDLTLDSFNELYKALHS